MPRYILVLLISIGLSVAGALGFVTRSEPGPAAVAVPEVRIDPGDGRDLSGVITSLEEAVRRLPDDHAAWATLALAYVEQVRVNGDTTLYERAQAAVDRSLAIKPDDNAAALAADSALLAVRHEFRGALASAEQALSIDPYHPVALVLRIDALTELGRYAAQMDALRVADRRQPGVPVVARYAYAFELRGDLAGAASILRRAAPSATGADRAHVLTLLADIERRVGDLGRTAQLLAEVRRTAPAYLPALISRARLAMARGRYEKAARLWERVVDRAAHPEHRVELLEIYSVLGQRNLVRDQVRSLVDYATRLTSAQLGRELDVALFMADHADPAVGLAAARAEWRSRRGIPAADALAWTLHRTGRSAAALRYARLATRLGTPDAMFWIHRGLIEAALGRNDQAQQHLRHALRLDAGVSPLARRQAEETLRLLR